MGLHQFGLCVTTQPLGTVLLSGQQFKFFQMCIMRQLEPWAELPVLWQEGLNSALLDSALHLTSLFSVCLCLHMQRRRCCHTRKKG